MASSLRQGAVDVRDKLPECWPHLSTKQKAAAIVAASLLIGGIVVAVGAAYVAAIGVAAVAGLALAMAYYVRQDRAENPAQFGAFGRTA